MLRNHYNEYVYNVIICTCQIYVNINYDQYYGTIKYERFYVQIRLNDRHMDGQKCCKGGRVQQFVFCGSLCFRQA